MTEAGDRPLPAFVWYVAYGSNLSASRFRLYVERCRDTTPPARWAPVEFPHRLLFARHSHRWGGGGVGFVDSTPSPGARTLGRAWLLTAEQFCDVAALECGLPVGSVELPPLDAGCVTAYPGHWYGCILPLGRLDAWPMVTFTDEAVAVRVANSPGAAYRAVIAAGLAETHGLTPVEADAYISRHSA